MKNPHRVRALAAGLCLLCGACDRGVDPRAADGSAPVPVPTDSASSADVSSPAQKREITAFELLAAKNPGLAEDVAGKIEDTSIALAVPFGTEVTALVPEIAITGVGVAPASGAAQDFKSPVSYTVTAEDGSTKVFVATVTVLPDCTPVVPPCDRSVYDRARAYAAANPTRDGGTWSQWCASLMWRFGALPDSAARESAIAAYHDSQIAGTDAAAALVGAFHWWDIGQYGHVGVDVLGGGGTVFMASCHLAASWGDCIGINSVSAYTAATGASYLGWSMDYAGGRIAGGGAPACDERRIVPEGCPVPPTATEQSGVPDGYFWMRLQRYAAQNGYSGPINGVMDQPSWAGVQRGLRTAGYTGPDDGVPGTNTYMAMQRIAAQYGYTGPIDGVLGLNSYRAFAAFLNDKL